MASLIFIARLVWIFARTCHKSGYATSALMKAFSLRSLVYWLLSAPITSENQFWRRGVYENKKEDYSSTKRFMCVSSFFNHKINIYCETLHWLDGSFFRRETFMTAKNFLEFFAAPALLANGFKWIMKAGDKKLCFIGCLRVEGWRIIGETRNRDRGSGVKTDFGFGSCICNRFLRRFK